ncbi:NHLP-related RiPP peptide [Dokdonella soli]|uniref:Uncharacterized protein n=1 Tax=Dokdonella soli TaxID=529810 RepID=A0ABN1IFZ8_9GAMM
MSDLTMVLQHLDTPKQSQTATIDGVTISAASESRKADVTLPKELAMVLLHKLASDDAYRQNYEVNPAQALAAIGVPADLIGALSPKSLAPTKLADRHILAEALRLIRHDAAETCLCQTPPQIKLTMGSLDAAGTKPFAIPFGMA